MSLVEALARDEVLFGRENALVSNLRKCDWLICFSKELGVRLTGTGQRLRTVLTRRTLPAPLASFGVDELIRWTHHVHIAFVGLALVVSWIVRRA